MQGKSSATTRIQRNHQTTATVMILRKSKQYSAIASIQWKTPNYLLLVLGYGENLNLACCYEIDIEKEKERSLDKGGKIIKTLILEEKD